MSVCEGQGSGEFPLRSTRAGQTRRIEPGLYSVALYRTALLWRLSLPPCLSLFYFPHPFPLLAASCNPHLLRMCTCKTSTRTFAVKTPTSSSALPSLQACELVVLRLLKHGKCSSRVVFRRSQTKTRFSERHTTQ